jgi:hypothetical protein
MKTMITALVFVALAASPTLAAKHLKEGRASAYVPHSDFSYQGTSREQMIHNTN